MKIIEHGETYVEVRCRNCGCKIGYTFVDVLSQIGSFADDYAIEDYIFCPECGEKIILRRH